MSAPDCAMGSLVAIRGASSTLRIHATVSYTHLFLIPLAFISALSMDPAQDNTNWPVYPVPRIASRPRKCPVNGIKDGTLRLFLRISGG